MKYEFSVPEMHCGHCQMRIEKALTASGKATSWKVDLGAKTVSVESAAPRADLAQVLVSAGYPPAEA